MNKKKKILRFKDKADLLIATELLSKENIMDIISPFPVDIRKQKFRSSSIIGIIAFIITLIVITLSIYFQHWTTSQDYPMNIGGRDFFYWVFSVPVTYELALLFAAIGAFVGFLILSGLPKWRAKEDEFYSLNGDFIVIYKSSANERITEKLNIKGIEYKIEDL